MVSKIVISIFIVSVLFILTSFELNIAVVNEHMLYFICSHHIPQRSRSDFAIISDPRMPSIYIKLTDADHSIASESQIH